MKVSPTPFFPQNTTFSVFQCLLMQYLPAPQGDRGELNTKLPLPAGFISEFEPLESIPRAWFLLCLTATQFLVSKDGT
jgi:hypothetical protein